MVLVGFCIPVRSEGIIPLTQCKHLYNDASRFLPTRVVEQAFYQGIAPPNNASRFLPTRAVGEWQFHNLS